MTKWNWAAIERKTFLIILQIRLQITAIENIDLKEMAMAAKRSSKEQAQKKDQNSQSLADENVVKPMCSQPISAPIVFSKNVSTVRAEAIISTSKKWINGTVLHYCFIDRNIAPSWQWKEDDKNIVRQAFKAWKSLGIGLSFSEVKNPNEAEIKIGCLNDNRSWSYVGTDVLTYNDLGRTMNFGWDLKTPWGKATALHEIGHSLGFEHEHQNPNAGIEWDEDAVYKYYKKHSNWDKKTTYHNIIRKLDANGLQGTKWDVDSNLHYPIAKFLIKVPEKYFNTGTGENYALSSQDKFLVKAAYPPLSNLQSISLLDLQSIPVEIGAESSFLFKPAATRKYRIQTIGRSDCRLVLFEVHNNVPKYILAEDDSGDDDNISVLTRLVADNNYIIRVRVNYVDVSKSDGIKLIVS